MNSIENINLKRLRKKVYTKSVPVVSRIQLVDLTFNFALSSVIFSLHYRNHNGNDSRHIYYMYFDFRTGEEYLIFISARVLLNATLFRCQVRALYFHGLNGGLTHCTALLSHIKTNKPQLGWQVGKLESAIAKCTINVQYSR